jgi:Undecaprenyl-phosphate galactose phosphotransferase WbaP
MHASNVLAAEPMSRSRVDQSDPYLAPQPGRMHDASWPSRNLRSAMLMSATLVAADLLSVGASVTIVWQVATMISPAATLEWAAVAAAFGIAVCMVNVAMGLYPGIGLSMIAEVRKAAITVAVIGPIFAIVSFQQHRAALAVPLTIVATCLVLPVSLPVTRALLRAAFGRFDWWGQPAVIAGGSAHAELIYSFLACNPRFGLRPLGVIGDVATTSQYSTPPNWLGPLSRAHFLLREFGNPRLIVAMPDWSHEGLQKLVLGLNRISAESTVMSYIDGSASLWRRASACLDWPGNQEPARQSSLPLAVKRAIDLTLTLLAAPLVVPLVAVIAALIKFGSPGPAIYRQERVGRNGRRFMVCKFRTMVCDGTRVLNDYLAANPKEGEQWERDHKLKHDPRVTRIGRILRKTSLDELPQLWNVLRGDMSIVGPRPILASEIVDFGSSFEAFCSVLPGITGLWQVSGRNQTTYAEHVELDRHYARNWSLWLDLYILVLTIKVVLFRHGAY